jgi:hypothetical protein
MENCIAEAPEAFLGRPLQLKSQQHKLGGFIPDLIFTDPKGQSVIVEVQRLALDRYHLYKCLEYRDLLAAEEHRRPTVVLVCETLPSRYQSIIATHDIEVHLLDRSQIIEIAIAHCPQSLGFHLTNSQDESFGQPPLAQRSLRRYRWKTYDTLSSIYGFVAAELGRCELWGKYINGTEDQMILWEAQRMLDNHPTYDDLLNPMEWRIDNLITKPKFWVPPKLENLTRIRKPKAEFYTFITSKGNLSVRWRPKLESVETEIHDWIKAPETEPYAYQRPANELLFIKNIRWLTPSVERYARFKNGDDREALNTMLLALVWGMIKHIQSVLSVTVDLEVLTEFQLTTTESPDEYSIGSRYDLTGWRLITTKALRVEEAEKRIAKATEKNNISLEIILQTIGHSLPPRKIPTT